MRRSFPLVALLIAGCSSVPAGTAPVAAQPVGDEAIRNYLLDSAAADFRAHGPTPAGFRNVRYGAVETAGGGAMSLVCGEFQAQGKGEEWIAFATLQTAKYEQLIGEQAKGFCQRPSFGWDKDELSAELQQRLDAAEK